jgi:hypothetical protein
MPVTRSNRNIVQALLLARDLSSLADVGEADSTDDGCAVLFGIVRDCAYKIRGRAERERDVHRVLGLWDVDVDSGKPPSEGASAPDFVEPSMKTERSQP